MSVMPYGRCAPLDVEELPLPEDVGEELATGVCVTTGVTAAALDDALCVVRGCG
ncbi:MAG: hypothetical protein JSS99_07785 [Actinobacteria bacterium]|nr:hypothetical protein [Actinomycetota bacterium]